MKNIYFIILSILIIFYIGHNVKKGNFTIKESFWWILGSIFMLFLSIFPKSIDIVAKKIGVSYPPSLLFVLAIVFLLFINFRNSKRIAEQQLKIIELAQNIALLKNNKK